jgi:hypothetical protein
MGRALVWGWSIPRKLTVPGWLHSEAVVVLAGMGLSTPRFGGQVLGANGSTLLPIGCTLLPALTMMGTAEGRRYGRLGLGPVQEARVLVGSVRVL